MCAVQYNHTHMDTCMGATMRAVRTGPACSWHTGCRASQGGCHPWSHLTLGALRILPWVWVSLEQECAPPSARVSVPGTCTPVLKDPEVPGTAPSCGRPSRGRRPRFRAPCAPSSSLDPAPTHPDRLCPHGWGQLGPPAGPDANTRELGPLGELTKVLCGCCRVQGVGIRGWRSALVRAADREARYRNGGSRSPFTLRSTM